MKRFLADAVGASSTKRARVPGSKPPLRAPPAGPQQLVRDGWTDLGQGARVGYFPGLLSRMATRALRDLLAGVGWEQHELLVCGRRVAQPRLIAYMGDPATPPYSYSGITLAPAAWHEVVLEVKAAVEALHPGTTYNSCLLNLYRDGSHHVAWHADNEALYGQRPTIASVSFGAPRDFIMRHSQQRSRKISTRLGAGDVLIMCGTTQQHWQHSVPPRKGVTQPRINLTFRQIVVQE